MNNTASMGILRDIGRSPANKAVIVSPDKASARPNFAGRLPTDILPCARLALLTYIKRAKKATPGLSNAANTVDGSRHSGGGRLGWAHPSVIERPIDRNYVSLCVRHVSHTVSCGTVPATTPQVLGVSAPK
ncbi:hypothetical protein [Paraburkholderia sp. 35.1]|uniref:hypothetical protein n=1 Tax=Paraburkholderia sp. 35.1 TaxID=2991058 RepID=UPI003D1C2CC4